MQAFSSVKASDWKRKDKNNTHLTFYITFIFIQKKRILVQLTSFTTT
jgi:hypothetical protein